MAVTEDTMPHAIKVIKWVETSSAGGAISSATTQRYSGAIVRLVVKPDGGGTQPTDQFDLVVNDSNSNDAIGGLGANLSNASTTQKAQKDGLHYVKDDILTLVGSNCGNAKGVTVWLYILTAQTAG